MAAVTPGLVAGLLALAECEGLRRLDLELHWEEVRVLVGTVAEGLVLRPPASAPPVGALVQSEHGWAPYRDDRLAHVGGLYH